MTSKGIDHSGLTFRQDYFGDLKAWQALVDLLKDTFDIDIGPLQQMGGPDPSSMPFGWFDRDGLLAANLSAFAMPLVINGRTLNAAAFQSGAVRPPWRRRGLYRDLTRKALAWCEEMGFEAIALYTDKPSLYEPYGFRSVPMHAYSGKAPAVSKAQTPACCLDPLDAADLELLRAALRAREPVSDVLAVCQSAAMFLINTQLDPGVRVSWMEREQAAIAWKMEPPGRLILLDVVAADIPSLTSIIGALDIEPGAVDVLFCPDKLGWNGEARPLDGHTHFMIRTPGAIAFDRPAMLSPMADF
ncbi:MULTISPECIES: GNAT family N-acetyltransferase [unclassified Rhizobium]|uniref:GNAT family N-acetyltransferase n=1 Tax=unclassified Rhizobium TaxID=2613769 RepID=UPI00160AA9C9|nr:MULTISPECIES: GNAT family N-acetyltransferase [unclassified Rhizobium]MBB3540560.1 GNAT superfamily N-acetyltransferase [Rhizobium sp. BK399]MCS3738430.1 GNAT superfamily N-acetyltransferase [Rhizobium sp. BK661]MCS4091550.1 GNAT superfamily N-acetyltransferase [Rhizobium sp. BK176]